MLGNFFKSWRQRPYTCARVDAKLEQYREKQLPAAETAAFEAHLTGCAHCRQLVQSEPAWLSTLRAEPIPVRLSAAERHTLQQALVQGMRRKMFMRNIRLSMQMAIAVAVLLLALGGLVWWQTAVAPQPASDPIVSTKPVAAIDQENGDVATIHFAASDRDRGTYTNLADQFMAENPDIRVEVLSIQALLNQQQRPSASWSEEEWRRLVSAADVIAATPTRSVVTAGLVQDLTPFINARPDFARDDFYPNLLARAQWQGGTWAIPTHASYQLIYFNKALFDLAGQTYPQPDWHWDDFLAAAQNLSRPETANAGPQWGFVLRWPDHLPLIRAQAGPLVNAETEPPTPLFDQPQVTAGVRWYTDLYLRHEVAPTFESAETDDASFLVQTEALINEGRAAMWPDWHSLWDLNNPPSGLNLGVVPFPVSEVNGETSPFTASGLVMSAGTTQAEAAWRWLDFLSHQAVEVRSATPPLPARRSTAAATGFWQQLDEETAVALQYALDHSYPLTEELLYRQHLAAALTRILSQNEPVEAALAAAKVNALAEQTTANQGTTAVPPIVVTTPTADTAVADKATTIRFSTLYSSQLQAYRSLAGAFQETHPHIRVEMFSPNWRLEPVTLPLVAANSDCFTWFNGFENPEYLASILVLDPFIENDPAFTAVELADFYPALLAQFTWQGQLWALPAEVQVQVIEYNKTLFDAAGLAYPAVDWTTDDFLETAVALTSGQEEEKQYGFAAAAFEREMLLLMLERQGAALLDSAAEPATVRFTDPATIEAMRWYTNLTNEYEAKPVFVTDVTRLTPDIQTNARALESLILNGRVAMWAYDTTALDLSDMERGIVPLPAAANGQSAGAYLSSTAYYLSAQAGGAERQACWEWLKFLSGQLTGSGDLPARRSLAESETYQSWVGEERAAAYITGVTGTTLPTIAELESDASPWLIPVSAWLLRAYGQAARTEQPVAEALADAQATFDLYRTCVIDNQAFYIDELWIACVAEVDADLADFYISLTN